MIDPSVGARRYFHCYVMQHWYRRENFSYDTVLHYFTAQRSRSFDTHELRRRRVYWFEAVWSISQLFLFFVVC